MATRRSATKNWTFSGQSGCLLLQVIPFNSHCKLQTNSKWLAIKIQFIKILYKLISIHWLHWFGRNLNTKQTNKRPKKKSTRNFFIHICTVKLILCEIKSPPFHDLNTHSMHHNASGYSPSGGKVETKSKLVRQLGETIDLSSFDYQSGRHQMLHTNPNLSPSPSPFQPSSSIQTMVNPFQRPSIRRSIHESSMGPPSPVASLASRYSQAI